MKEPSAPVSHSVESLLHLEFAKQVGKHWKYCFTAVKALYFYPSQVGAEVSGPCFSMAAVHLENAFTWGKVGSRATNPP